MCIRFRILICLKVSFIRMPTDMIDKGMAHRDDKSEDWSDSEADELENVVLSLSGAAYDSEMDDEPANVVENVKAKRMKTKEQKLKYLEDNLAIEQDIDLSQPWSAYEIDLTKGILSKQFRAAVLYMQGWLENRLINATKNNVSIIKTMAQEGNEVDDEDEDEEVNTIF